MVLNINVPDFKYHSGSAILKNERNEFCMSNDYGNRIDSIASKFLVEVAFG